MLLTLAQVEHTLNTCDEPYTVMPLKGGITILILQRGGRIFAFDSNGDSLYSVNTTLANPDDFSGFVRSKQWNLGGERIWIAPEIQYIIHDRFDFWNSHHLPPAIDPGNYQLTGNEDKIALSQKISLEAFNIANGTKDLSIKREIGAIDNPLRFLSQCDDLMSGLRYAGYQQTVHLKEENNTPMHSEAWNLVQLIPGGTLFIPAMSPVETAIYFGQADESALSTKDGCIRIPITGNQQYKVGYKAAMMTGRMAYLKHTDDENGYLLIRSFDNNPAAVYTEEPPEEPDNRGFSVHVYNDDGKFGGFGEMECNGQAIGKDTGRKSSADSFHMWVFTGQNSKLKRIAEILLGVSA